MRLRHAYEYVLFVPPPKKNLFQLSKPQMLPTKDNMGMSENDNGRIQSITSRSSKP